MTTLHFHTVVKFIVAVVGAGLLALQSAVTDGITLSEGVGIAIAVVTALGVYALPNKTEQEVHPEAGNGPANEGVL